MSFDPFDFKNTMPSINEDSEFFPLMSSEDEAEMNNEEVPDIISILPLRNTVLFPGVVIPITVGRDKSIKLIRDANKGSRLIGVVAQQDVSIEDPTFSQLNKVGTIALIIKMLQMPDGNTTVILQGKKRFTLREEVQTEPYIKASIDPFKEVKAKEDKEFKAMVSSVKDMAMNIIQLSPNIPSEAGIAIRNIESTSFLINFISSNMNADMAAKQALLQTASLRG
jgi:ATP-dependent Lon protease